MSNNAISLLIADDHPVLLSGLQDELSKLGYHIVGVAANGATALELIRDKEPDIALLDVRMPLLSGFEVVQKITQLDLKTKCIILTTYEDEGYIFQAEKLKIAGYLTKEEPIEVIDICIKKVLSGESYFSERVANMHKVSTEQRSHLISTLTPSERTILRHISQNLTSQEISDTLSISIRTVQKHRTNIINKLKLDPPKDSLKEWVRNNQALVQQL